MGNKAKNKDKTSKIGRNLVILFIFVGIFTLIYSIYNKTNISTDTSLVTLPLIETTVNSPSDGTRHTVKANISYSISKSKYRNYNQEDALNITTMSIELLDYDRLLEPDGTDYLKGELARRIAMNYPEIVDSNFDVYVSGYDLGLVEGHLPGLIQDSNNKLSGNNLDNMFGK